MFFRRVHYMMNLITRDQVYDAAAKEYKPRQIMYQEESFFVKSMKLFFPNYQVYCTEDDTIGIIESSNYITVVRKIKGNNEMCKVEAFKYDQLISYEFDTV